jgi:tellurium resistance protein TerZ
LKEKTDVRPDLKEIVMGLHWDPPREGATDPGNLDALCILFDAQGRVLEAIYPGNPRNANGSVLHTGDSPTGASVWDDERIFVFLEAVPAAVSTIAFVVASANGHTFGEVPGASCHVSDRVTEHAWIRLELTALGHQTIHGIATLRRGPAGWELSKGAQEMSPGMLAEMLSSPAARREPANALELARSPGRRQRGEDT